VSAKIEDYAMIGDCRTAALVSLDGSIDWLCLPRFDSGACFTRLLGTPEQGCWRIGPSGARHASSRSYIDGSLVLQTRFESRRGVVELTDFMPTGLDSSHVVRIVSGVQGRMTMESNLLVRFDYGVSAPWTFESDSKTTVMIAGPDCLALRSEMDGGAAREVTREVSEGHIVSKFEVKAGERFAFVLSHGPSHLPPPSALAPERLLQKTRAYWKGWSGRCKDAGRWSGVVRRSLITLKGLTYAPTGGIVAAVTTSLPERIGGDRNWDYRYCWLRDATVTLLSLLRAGYDEEAEEWRAWLLRAAAGNPEQIQIMYGVAGEKRLEEWTLPWLCGYENSQPVRVGNEAASQVQLDIYGELFHTMSIAVEGSLLPLPHGLAFGGKLLDVLEKTWASEDSGIWEMRGDPRHFTHSKLMAWVAFDRAANNPHYNLERAKQRHYRRIAEQIHASICQHALDPGRNCFVQSYGSAYVDASLLLMPLVGFLPATDERVRNTVAEIERRLLVDGLVLRYETASGVDGLTDGEGVFLACSFWLLDNYVLQGRLDEAEALFERLVSLGNDVGLFAEEYDPRERRLLGNFPQAFTHVALVNSAFLLAEGQRKGQEDVTH
jgi:GH15 family glucan-1,4-alpha-glucosidase